MDDDRCDACVLDDCGGADPCECECHDGIDDELDGYDEEIAV